MFVQLPRKSRRESRTKRRTDEPDEYRLARVDFRITLHAGWAAPDDALDLLWERLEGSKAEASFARRGRDIRATWGIDVPVAMERDEREQLGRSAILEIVRAVCEQTPELKSDWYAVSLHH
jgi:hypothetical protein